MSRGAITSYIDVAQVVLYAFWIFFAGLIFYLRREDRREGYPLESEVGRATASGHYLIPAPKSFRLADGSVRTAPRAERDTREHRLAKVEPWPGSPFSPVGDPMTAGVGPGAYAMRADVPDKTHHGEPLIAPLRVAGNFFVSERDPDPRGMRVYGADSALVGTVRDIWVDRAEFLARYYEVSVSPPPLPPAGPGKFALPDHRPARNVLLPVTFAKMDKRAGRIGTSAILAAQFAGVPGTKNPDQVTKLEEEQITAYYGAGLLYATPLRTESQL